MTLNEGRARSAIDNYGVVALWSAVTRGSTPTRACAAVITDGITVLDCLGASV